MNLKSVYDDMSAELLASSISPEGVRLDTFKLRYWRAIHSELMTHRQFSRNASSSRAIPASKLREKPVLYPEFRHNQRGMQPGQPLSSDEQEKAREIWSEAAEACLSAVEALSAKDELNIHKQWPNRLLEWFTSIEVVVSSTDWENFWALRDHPDAQDEIRHLAGLMRQAYNHAEPVELDYGQWHLPFIRSEDDAAIKAFLEGQADALTRKNLYGEPAEDLLGQAAFAFSDLPDVTPEDQCRLVISAARCARASYMNFRGDTAIEQDFQTFFKLAGSQPVHATPLEHQAKPCRRVDGRYRSGNFWGWSQFRKFVPGEAVFDR